MTTTQKLLLVLLVLIAVLFFIGVGIHPGNGSSNDSPSWVTSLQTMLPSETISAGELAEQSGGKHLVGNTITLPPNGPPAVFMITQSSHFPHSLKLKLTNGQSVNVGWEQTDQATTNNDLSGSKNRGEASFSIRRGTATLTFTNSSSSLARIEIE
jgi:hypothetical protein